MKGKTHLGNGLFHFTPTTQNRFPTKDLNLCVPPWPWLPLPHILCLAWTSFRDSSQIWLYYFRLPDSPQSSQLGYVRHVIWVIKVPELTPSLQAKVPPATFRIAGAGWVSAKAVRLQHQLPQAIGVKKLHFDTSRCGLSILLSSSLRKINASVFQWTCK